MAQQGRVGSHKTSVRISPNGTLSVVYHGTEVVKASKSQIVLDTGGWFTNTTKTRMNQASNQYGLGFYVSQKKGVWYVRYKGKSTVFRGNRKILKR